MVVKENKKEKETEKEIVPNVTMKVTSSAFPMNLFREWDKDCKERFGDCRWMKMWNDHLASKSMEMYIDLAEQLSEMKSRVSILEEKPEQEEKVVETVKTFSSGNEKGDK